MSESGRTGRGVAPHDRDRPGRGRRSLAAVTAGGLLAALLAAVGPAPAQASPGFTIHDRARTTPVLIDASYGGEHGERDYRQVRRAVQDLRQDVAMVTGGIDSRGVQGLFADDEAAKEARLASADPDSVPALLTEAGGTRTAIIVGVVGQSALVDEIIGAGRFDEAAGIDGKWEAYATKTVMHPVPGLDSALVVAGSDARGAIYGIYSLSEQIGVSPWYWYSDVPVEHRDRIVVDGSAHVDDGPDVRYRGIFINDEERTADWAKVKFPTGKGTPDVNYYRHVFELMLRLRLNTLWPAMHAASRAFNAATDTGTYDDGTPINAREAAAYGVVASSSHAELMLRNNEGEWRPFYDRNKEALHIQGADYRAAYDYSINKPALIEYWRRRIVANKEFENIFALGIRGVHDSAPVFTPGNPYGFANTIEMVGDAITEQRKLIEEIYGSATAVPQVFIPYKEMGDLYNAGLKAYIPDDVTLMWAEDNQGYLRQVPTRTEAARSGGNGVYYHISYWGEPKSYLWLNSTPMSLMVQQLHRAWNSGAGRYWILNVGDIKPGEIKTELFAKLAWDVDGYDDTNLESRFLAEQVQRDFHLSGSRARVVAGALTRFDVLENTKRAEFWGAEDSSGTNSGRIHDGQVFPFSATSDGDELQRYINEANGLVRILEGVSARLDERSRSAFYQQVLHRVRSYRNMAEQIGYYWKNQVAAEQGRYASAGSYELLSKQARERIGSDEEYWDGLSGGKWKDLIWHSHPEGFPNEGTVMLANERYARVATPHDEVGAAAEGDGTLRFNSASPDDERFFDVFSRSDVTEPREWVAETDAAWITLSDHSGRVTTEQRVTVTVDKRHPSGTGKIQVYNAVNRVKTGEPVATFTVDAARSAVDLRRQTGPSHLEANGYVALEAEHFSRSVPGTDGSTWRPIAGVGQRGASMGAFPEIARRVDSGFGGTARLTYRIHFTSSGTFTGTVYRVPTLNEGTEDDGTPRTARTAIGLDDQVPSSAQLRGNSVAGTSTSAWGNNIMHGIEPLRFTIDVPVPGWHDLVVYRSDAAILFDRIVIETVGGAVGDGLVGPPESPNNIAGPDSAQRAVVAPLPGKMPELRRLSDVGVPVGGTQRVEGVTDAVTAESDNQTAASVAVDDGEVTVSGNRAGISQLTITTADGATSSLTVTVHNASGPPRGAYLEKSGLVVVDTADALDKSASANAIDSNNGTHKWQLARNGLQSVPPGSAIAPAKWNANTAAEAEALFKAGPTDKVNGSSAAGSPPRLEFTVHIETGGTYYLFANTSNPNADADSYHVVVDGQWKYNSAKSGPETADETWYDSTSIAGSAMTLEPGDHTITVAPRESGLEVNQLALTTNQSPGFTGFLTPSERTS